MIAGATFSLLAVSISYASFRLPWLRPVLHGEPVVIVRDGEVLERTLRRERLTVAEVEPPHASSR